jgi:hypothetical protein
MTKTRAGQFNVHAGTPIPVPEPTRRYGVDVRSIVCPECDAAIGEGCSRPHDGTAMKNYHAARRRMATRKANADRDHVAAGFIGTISAARRRHIRISRGLSLDEAGAIFAVNRESFRRLEDGDRHTPDLVACAYGAWLKLWDPMTPDVET